MKVGIVGTGGMGSVHAKAYADMPDVELFAYDRNLERLYKVIAPIGAAPRSGVETLVDEVDVVDICVPTDVHEEVATHALAKGKSVFCEKPLARTLDSARRMIDAAKNAGGRFGVGQVVRYFLSNRARLAVLPRFGLTEEAPRPPDRMPGLWITSGRAGSFWTLPSTILIGFAGRSAR
jgi:predicted dehydrogenase